MIINALLGAVAKVVEYIALALPDIPDLPVAITDVGDNLSGYIVSGWSFIASLFGGTFLVASITIAVAIMYYERIYRVFMWAVRKLPIPIE